VTATAKRFLSVYIGRRLLGHLEITLRERRRPKVAAKDADGRHLGIFKSQRVALAAIDEAAR
jgi:hypothetical protein